jgi:hypothetical protein
MRSCGFRTDAKFAGSRASNARAGGALSASGELLGGAAEAYAMKRT